MTQTEVHHRRNRTRMILFGLIVLIVAGSFLALLVTFLIARNPSLVQ